MVKEVELKIGEHPVEGKVLVLSSIEETARDTSTRPEEWDVTTGWVEIEKAKELPTVREAILAGRLPIREAP